MFCPSCGCEYRPGFDTCSDCNVALVEELPQDSSSGNASGGSGERADAALAWAGNDSRRHAQAYATLERAGFHPYTVSHQDRLFGTSERPQFEVYVAPELADKAKEVLDEPTLSPEEWNELERSGAFELPDDDALEEESSQHFTRRRHNWNPEDATAEIWTGEDASVAEMIAASLRENQIDCLNEAVPTDAEYEQGTAARRLLVVPEDEERGKEIVREIVDATPL